MFSCGQKEYIARASVIAHATCNVYGGARMTDVKTNIIIIVYGLRTFNTSMWGSLRLALNNTRENYYLCKNFACVWN